MTELKLSDISVNIDNIPDDIYNAVFDYLRIDDIMLSDARLLKAIIFASKAFIQSSCGIAEDFELDKYPDLTIAFLVLCAEMYDNRTYIVTNDKINPLVKSILDLHNRNVVYCPEREDDQ